MKFRCVYFFILISFLTSCASYKAQPLESIGSRVYDVSKPKDSSELLVVAKKLSLKESKQYFDRNIFKAGYYPVQLYIENSSDKSYVFSLNRINLPVASSEMVAPLVHTSTVARAVGYGTAAIFIAPLFVPFGICAIVDGIKSSEANQALDIDFREKSAKDQVIGKYSHFNKVLFIPSSDYSQLLSITLLEAGSLETKTLDVIISEF
ncbi:MAG: hypothetical protein NT065_03925 [Chlamydiae bacterium]|nr:hypothetical protein [Chlamydiota bacterium]